MKKSDIQNRLSAIETRLQEMVAACESEKRQLTDAETKEKNNLIAERSSLNRQLEEINSGGGSEQKPVNKPSFSLVSAIRSVVAGGQFEGEYADQCREMANRSKLSYEGQILMKATAPAVRALDGVITAGNNYADNSHNGGLEMVATDVLPIIDALYNYTILERAGANFFNGLVGNAKIPTMSNINFAFKAENEQATNVTPTMGKAELTPKRLTGYVYISKQLLNQSSEDIERRIRASISKAIAQAFEGAVLGYGTTPHNGIMYGATEVTAASVTYDTVLALAQDIYDGNMAPTYVVDPAVARILKQKSRLAYGNSAVMADGMVDDTTTFITKNLAAAASGAGALACADFSRLHCGTWGDLLDIVVDPYTRAAFGEVVLTLNYYCDWAWDVVNGIPYAVRKVTSI